MYRQRDSLAHIAAYPRTSNPDVFLGRALPRTRGIYRYWDSKRGARRMPARSDIDPVEMRLWLPGIQLVDVSHHPRRLVYRLVGQVDVDFRGYNPTGKTVEECGVGLTLADTLRNYDIVISERTFVYDYSDYKSASGLLRSQECILFPLSDDDDLVNMVMTYAEADSIR
jgi:hypothetical protein